MPCLLRRCLTYTSCLLLFLLSCSPQPRVEEFEASIGHSGQDELIRRFGYPQQLKKLLNGNETWDYEFLAGGSRCVGYRVFFDDDQRSTGWESRPCRSD
jgi:hypothetical protein